MSDLVVAANRGPATFVVDDAGRLVPRHGAGGLAPSLAKAIAGSGATWVAAAMSEGDRLAATRGEEALLGGGISLRLVELAPEVQSAAYQVVANATLWFLHHGLFDASRRPVLDRHWHEAWTAFRAYNDAFAEAIMASADDGATVVVHDYHLPLVGARLAAERPDLATVHFSHTPFCSPGELGVLPRAVARELLASMASFGSCGFHTARWEASFRACATEVLGEAPVTFHSALGVDAAELAEVSASPGCSARRAELLGRLDGRRLLFRSDRIELSKNLLRGFLAFEELLEARPDWRGRVVFIARAYQSRGELAEYRAYRNEVTHLAERINERFPAAEPHVRLEVEDDFEASVAALSCYDVLLVNPVRDGMNLVAKEGPVVNGRAGVLALSREAGAFAELGSDALEVEPFDVSGTAATLLAGLEMEPGERRARAERLAGVAGSRPPAVWFAEVRSRAARPVGTPRA